jgi:hypothetical protein
VAKAGAYSKRELKMSTKHRPKADYSDKAGEEEENHAVPLVKQRKWREVHVILPVAMRPTAWTVPHAALLDPVTEIWSDLRLSRQ